MKRIIILIICLISNISFASDNTEVMMFKFNPPDGISFIEKSHEEKVRDLGLHDRQIDLYDKTMSVTISRTPDGYVLREEPFYVEMTRNSQPFPEPITRAMMSFIFEYTLDYEGRMLNMKGYDRVFRKMKEAFPALPPSMMEMLNKKTLFENKHVKNQDRISRFVGKKFKVGEVWMTKTKYPLPKGIPIEYVIVTIFRKMQKCGNNECLRMEFVYDSDPETLKEYLKNVYGMEDSRDVSMINNLLPEDKTKKRHLTGKGYRVIDPDTMMIYQEENNILVEMSINSTILGQVDAKVSESSKHTYQYR